MAATKREMLLSGTGLVVNAYHDAEGRGNYFPGSAGTSEGQFAMITGCLEAWLATGDPLAKDLGELTISGVLQTLYRNGSVPDVVGGTEIFAPHWLFNVKYETPSTNIYLYTEFNFINGVAMIPDLPGDVRYVFHVRSLDSVLLWDNPYSALSKGQFYAVASTVYIEGEGMQVTLEAPRNGAAVIAYSTKDGPPILVGQPFEAWPDWRRLDSGEIDCAVDTLVWAHRAYTLAADVFDSDTWRQAARATAEQAVIAYDINDSRDWIKPSWSKDPFAVGSSFSFSNRQPPPVFSRDSSGNIRVTAGRSSGETQYGNASRLDVYNEGDYTEVTIGSSKPVTAYIYIDQYQNYTVPTRFIATMQLPGTGLQTYTLHRTDFVNSTGELPLNSPVYTVGLITRAEYAHQVILERIRQMPALDVMYYPGAIPFTANFLGNPAQLIDWRGPVYMGYQSPDMWLTIGNAPAATTCLRMLRDSQLDFAEQTGSNEVGPFTPVFYFKRADAVQYGPSNTFGWEGPDPNTKWGGYQYRPLVEVAKALQVLTGEGLGLATGIYTDWLTWLASNQNWPLGGGPPTDFPENVPRGEVNYPEPHMAALIMRAIIYRDQGLRPNGQGAMGVTDTAVLNKCWALLQATWNDSGRMAGTFSTNPAGAEWFGFWHAEILTTLSIAVMWGESTGAQPAIAAQSRLWISDMLRFARANVYLEPSKWGDFLWESPPNWDSGVTEAFEFVTEITTSAGGVEHRQSLRQQARRSLRLSMLLVGEQARVFDEMVRDRQIYPNLVPQWHLAKRLAVTAPANTRLLTLDESLDNALLWGGFIVIAFDKVVTLLQVESTAGATVTLVTPLEREWPAGARVMSAMRGTLNSSMATMRYTSNVMMSDATFDMLPQEDRRGLPDLPATAPFAVNDDLREIVTFKPNWIAGVNITDDWKVQRIDYAAGPVEPVFAENQGRRSMMVQYSFFSSEQAEAFLGLFKRLQGRRRACWVPSGNLDFVATRGGTEGSTNLFVKPTVLANDRLIDDPAMGIVLKLRDGTWYGARVSSITTISAAEVRLSLDRQFPRTIARSDILMINMMFRCRLANDTVTLAWKTTEVAETQITWTTVFNETTNL